MKDAEEDARQLRRQAEELEFQAQRSPDPARRRELIRRALEIRRECERLGGPEAATMDPM
ncbi:DUF6381 family protein [Streptomyces sp. NPDC048606]|uniref:DUF6381 family protein n=1 Tax=Streptomyces sp. NPDC048606 TaxID=3154726 RepID=UPI0034331B47